MDEVAREPGVDGCAQRQHRLKRRDEEIGERREDAERRLTAVGLDGIARHVDGEAADPRDAAQRKGGRYEPAEGAELQRRPNALQPDGGRQVVRQQQAPPAEGHRHGGEDDVPGHLEDEPDCQQADDTFGEHRDRDPPQVLRLLQEPEHDVAHRLEGLAERHCQDQVERDPLIAEAERHCGDGGQTEHGADQAHGQVDAERIVFARVGRLEQPQVEVGQGDDGSRQREAEREAPHVGRGSELGHADEDSPLAGAVAEIANEGPRHVAPKRGGVCGFR